MFSILIVAIIIAAVVVYVVKTSQKGKQGTQPHTGQTTRQGENPPYKFEKDGTIAMDRGGFLLQQLNYLTRQGEAVCGENGRLETKVAKSFNLNQDRRFEAGQPLRIVRSNYERPSEDTLFTDPHIYHGEDLTAYIGSQKFYIQKGLIDERITDTETAPCPAIFIRTVSDLSAPKQDPILIVTPDGSIVKTDTVIVPMGGRHCAETSYRLIDSNDGYAQTSAFFLAYQPFRVVKTADFARAAELLRPIEVKS